MAKGPFEIVRPSTAHGIDEVELFETADSSKRKIRVVIETKDTPHQTGLREKLEHVRDLLDAEIKAMQSSQP